MSGALDAFQQGILGSLSESEDDSSVDSLSDIDYNDLNFDYATAYLTTRHGRLLHSHGISLYPLPVDAQEQRRQIAQSVVLRQTIEGNYVGPVPQALAQSPGRQKLVLDLGTGSGQWIIEMALQFPHVQFVGLDIVPIVPVRSLLNVQFELHDINERTRWADGSIDLVHARSLWLTTPDYRMVLQEMARVLRPGGLFLSCEWGIHPTFHPCYDLVPPIHAPGAYRFCQIINHRLHQRGIESFATLIPGFLRESGRFDQIDPQAYYIPIGPWHPDSRWQRIGRIFRAVYVSAIEAWKPMLREAGYSEGDVDEICGTYVRELYAVRGMVGVYHTVWARKRPV